jgi:hypothetical protein
MGAYAAAVDAWVPRGRRAVAAWLGRRFARPAAALDGWWAERTPRARAWIKLALLAISVGVLYLTRPAPPPEIAAPSSSNPAAPPPAAADEGGAAADAPPGAVSPPAAVDGGAAPPSTAGVGSQEAEAVAVSFATAFGSWRYDDAAGAFLERARPLATPGLLGQLAANHSSGAAFRQRMVDERMVATAELESVQVQRSAPGEVVFVVVARQRVVSTRGVETRHPAYLLRVVWTDGAWRVAEFMP